MRTTHRDALVALHAGLIGQIYPTYKMIPEPSGSERLLMHAATFEEVDGVIDIIEFGSETVDPNPKRCNSGYHESVIESLSEKGLVSIHYGQYDRYPALFLTCLGIEQVTEMFGRPTTEIRFVEKNGDDVIQVLNFS